jgi:hypothetical protein
MKSQRSKQERAPLRSIDEHQRLPEMMNICTTRLLAPPYLYPVLGSGPSSEDMAHELPHVLVHHILPVSTFFSLEITDHLFGPVVHAKTYGIDPLVIHEATLILGDASKLVEQPVAVDLLYGELFRETVILGDEGLSDGELVLVKHWYHGILNNPPLLLGSRALSVDYRARVSLSRAHQLHTANIREPKFLSTDTMLNAPTTTPIISNPDRRHRETPREATR